MKYPIQSTVYVACATVLFGCLATEIGTSDYNDSSLMTKIMVVGIVALSGWILFDSIQEYKKNR